MPTLLRRTAIFTIGLLAVLFAFSVRPTPARAGDVGDDYGGYDDSWESCDSDCCCEEPEPPHPHCFAFAMGRMRACEVDLGNCPAPANTTAPVDCYQFPNGLSSNMGAQPSSDLVNDLAAFRSENCPPGYNMYVRFMTCSDGTTAVASIHFVSPTYPHSGDKTLKLPECAQSGVDPGTHLMWLRPIDPPCGGDIFLYRN